MNIVFCSVLLELCYCSHIRLHHQATQQMRLGLHGACSMIHNSRMGMQAEAAVYELAHEPRMNDTLAILE